jgi:hypothetical protein
MVASWHGRLEGADCTRTEGGCASYEGAFSEGHYYPRTKGCCGMRYKGASPNGQKQCSTRNALSYAAHPPLHTRSNNPFTIFEEDKEPDKHNITTNAPTPLQLPLQATIAPCDPFIQEMLDQPQQTTQAIHDLRPQRRVALTANPTTHPSPTILPRSKPNQTFTPTALPPRKPTKIATLPTGPAYIQHNYNERDDHYNP